MSQDTRRAPRRKSSKEPGPGDFQSPAWPEPLAASNQRRIKSYSVPLSRRLSKDADRKAYAGPGCFSPSNSLTWEKSSSWGFGTEVRFKGSDLGSGDRNPDASLTLGHSSQRSKSKWMPPQCAFGTARRFPKQDKHSYWSVQPTPPAGVGVPGPGHHRPEDHMTSKWTSSPSFTHAARLPVADRNEPGPGDYQVAKSAAATREAAPQVGAPKAKRNTEPGATAFQRRRLFTSPGPDAYGSIGHDRKGGKSFGASRAGKLFAMASRKLTFSTLY
eukprot:TRINITY_DN19783_c0_g1_i1.p1 TRINITY_DN19783_c0_g1~~TRINITY_DN19783_c0_g1_i1.p1  ORF type:complete len:273 (+),score=16.72 TRINITY_DN19783_c0_g1_i1:94-912(+)